jgi:hypothetical protein
LFYVLIEFLDGALPWTEARRAYRAHLLHELSGCLTPVVVCMRSQEARSEKERVLPMKEQLLTNPSQLTKNVALPTEVSAVLQPPSRVVDGLCDDVRPPFFFARGCSSAISARTSRVRRICSTLRSCPVREREPHADARDPSRFPSQR